MRRRRLLNTAFPAVAECSANTRGMETSMPWAAHKLFVTRDELISSRLAPLPHGTLPVGQHWNPSQGQRRAVVLIL